MIKVVSWNISKRNEPWRALARMAREGKADVALLQEAGNPPDDLEHPLWFDSEEFWKGCRRDDRPLYDRWCMVVRLSDRVDLDWFRSIPPISELGEREFGVSGTIAAARVAPRGWPEDDAFTVVSMYARWIKPHPSTATPWRVGASDVSAHPLGSVGLRRP